MAHPHVPEFGKWDGGDDVPYTVLFEKARKGWSTGKMINPNNPQEDPNLFWISPRAQPRAPPPQLRSEPEESTVRGLVRPGQEHRTSRENSESQQSSESPARNENGGKRAVHSGGRGPNYGWPTRKSVGSVNLFERSPLHPRYGAKVAAKGSASSSWEEKNSYDSSHGTPERSRMKPVNRGRENPDRGVAVPKFGEWDESDPSSMEGVSDTFNQVREERITGGRSPPRVNAPPSPPRRKRGADTMGCCFRWGRK